VKDWAAENEEWVIGIGKEVEQDTGCIGLLGQPS
jgi:hypothetical protein